MLCFLNLDIPFVFAGVAGDPLGVMMKRFSTVCLSVGAMMIGSLGLTGCDTPQEIVISNPAEPIAILDSGQGNDAGLVLADAYLLSNERQLAATGAVSLQGLGIDYEHNALVVVALGEKQTGGHGVTIDSVQLEGGTLVVNVYTQAPAAGDSTTQQFTYPYGYAVVPDVTAFSVVVNELN